MNRLLTLLAVAGICSSAAFAVTAQAGEKLKELPAFSQLDTDADRHISADEAKAHEWLSKNFSKADTDQDGRISQSEYLALVKMKQ